MKAELEIKEFLKAIKGVPNGLKQQPCCVQVVEWVGLGGHSLFPSAYASRRQGTAIKPSLPKDIPKLLFVFEGMH